MSLAYACLDPVRVLNLQGVRFEVYVYDLGQKPTYSLLGIRGDLEARFNRTFPSMAAATRHAHSTISETLAIFERGL